MGITAFLAAFHVSLRSVRDIHTKVSAQTSMLAAATIWTTLRKWGGPGLFIIGIIDSSFIPTLGSLDVFNALLAARHHDLWWYYALMSMAGSVVGAYVTYRLAGRAGQGWIRRRLGESRVARMDKILKQWGSTAVVVSCIAPPPFPSSAFFAASGALQFPIRKYMVAVLGGRAFRYALVAWIASHYSRHIVRVFRHPQQYLPVTLGISAALILLAIAAAWIWNHAGQEVQRAQQEGSRL
jgi:membrane protein YqaA with SNARE-associated domain